MRPIVAHRRTVWPSPEAICNRIENVPERSEDGSSTSPKRPRGQGPGPDTHAPWVRRPNPAEASPHGRFGLVSRWQSNDTFAGRVAKAAGADPGATDRIDEVSREGRRQ